MSLINLCDAHACPCCVNNNNCRQSPLVKLHITNQYYQACLETIIRESEGQSIELERRLYCSFYIYHNRYRRPDCETGDKAYPTINEGMEPAVTLVRKRTLERVSMHNGSRISATVVSFPDPIPTGTETSATDVATIKTLQEAYWKRFWHTPLFLTDEDISEDSCANTMKNYRYTKQFEKAHVFNIKATSSFSKDHPDHYQSLLQLKTTDLQNTMGSAAAAVPRVEVGSTSKTPILVPGI